MPRTLMSILGVTCSYGSFPALSGVTVEIPKGESLGIIGPNGSGKSTLLRAISRALPPAEGQVLLSERDLYDLTAREVARKMAVVGQGGKVDFEFTSQEVVLMGRLPHLGRFERESSRDIESARKAMEMTDTLALAERLVTELSGGERQRVLIARALAQEPEILLLDEPTSHLDIGHQVEILDLLERLNRSSGLTLISVFHDLNLAARYCTRLLLLSKGRIYVLGSPEEVITAGNIREVYGSEVLLTRHPLHGTPHVILLSPSAKRCPTNPGLSLHVIGGGGMSSVLLEKLCAEGFDLTAGVLNIGDADWQKARDLGVPVAEALPFSPLTQDDASRAIEMMLRSGLVVIGRVPFGPGNLPNLQAALKAQGMGVALIAVEDGPIEERDYTGGQASEIFRQLVSGGMLCVENDREACVAASRMAKEARAKREEA